MGQAGFMTFEETLHSMKLFTEEVYPRLKELTASYDSGVMRELRSSRPDVENIDVSVLASEFVRWMPSETQSKLVDNLGPPESDVLYTHISHMAEYPSE